MSDCEALDQFERDVCADVSEFSPLLIPLVREAVDVLLDLLMSNVCGMDEDRAVEIAANPEHRYHRRYIRRSVRTAHERCCAEPGIVTFENPAAADRAVTSALSKQLEHLGADGIRVMMHETKNFEPYVLL